MGISELLAKIGDENIRFQNLDISATGFKKVRGGSQVTFDTEEGFGLEGTEKLGLVVWLDRAKVKEIIGK